MITAGVAERAIRNEYFVLYVYMMKSERLRAQHERGSVDTNVTSSSWGLREVILRTTAVEQSRRTIL